MKNIIINISPIKSHYYTCLSIIESLKAKGYNIFFLVHENKALHDFVMKLGYEPLIYKINENKYFYFNDHDIKNWRLLIDQLREKSHEFSYSLLLNQLHADIKNKIINSDNEAEVKELVVEGLNLLVGDNELFKKVQEQNNISRKSYSFKRLHLIKDDKEMMHVDNAYNARLFNRFLIVEILFPHILKSPLYLRFYKSDNLIYRIIRKILEMKYFTKIQYEHYAQYINEFFPEGEIGQLLKEKEPVLCIFERNTSENVYFIKELKIPAIQISLSLFNDKAPNVPPVTSGYIPKNSALSRLKVNILWFKIKLKKFNILSYLGGKILATPEQKKIFNKFSKLKNKYKHLVYTKSYGIGMKGIHEIIPGITEFEFPIEEKFLRTVHFTGFDLNKSQLTGFNWEEIKKNKHLVYCSFGRSFSIDKGNIIRLYLTLIEIFKRKPDHTLILSLSNIIPLEIFKGMPENIHIFNWVPQMEVLSKSDLMITHGGTKTIQECIVSGVPMLVFPLFGDQHGHSAKVVYHKLGMRCNLKKYSVSEIENKLSAILKDSYSENVRNMYDFQKNYNANKSADIIESIIA